MNDPRSAECSAAYLGVAAVLVALALAGAPAWGAPQAICVPWVPSDQNAEHFTYSGAQTRLKGIARGGATEYYWDFGDGTSTAWSAVTNPYALEATHVYTGFIGRIFIATLVVRDASGEQGQDTYPVKIYESSNLAIKAHQDVRIHMAIDEGLWWLHKNLVRGTFAGGSPGFEQPYGYWSDSYALAATAAAVDAFQLHGSRVNGVYATDPYVETVQRAINYILYNTYVFNIAPQTYGNPDVNGNGIGLVANMSSSANDSRQTYIGGICMAALASSDAPNAVAAVGRDQVVGRTFKDIVQDMVDFFAWGQVDSGSGRGGWRYYANYSGSDMSTTQWPPLAMLAAEQNMCCVVPPFVRSELLYFLTYAQHTACDNDHGGFGYADTSTYINCTKAGAGLICHEFLGTLPTDARFQGALGFLYRHWNDTGTSWSYQRLLGNSYGMYGVMKAMRIPQPDLERVIEYDCATPQPTGNSFDWYYATSAEPREGLAHYLVRTQQADGSWDDVTPAPNPLYDAFATGWRVLILLKGVVILPPVAVIANCGVGSFDIEQDIPLDGSRSYHPDPTRDIVRHEWDLDYDGVTFDIDTTGESVVIRGGFPDYGTHKIALRVLDDNLNCFGERQSDLTTCGIVVKPPPHCPHACLEESYLGWINEPIDLSALCSWDPNDDIAGYAWDLDNDGAFDDAVGAVATWAWPVDGDYTICVQVVDATSCGLPDDYDCASETACTCLDGTASGGCARAACARVEIGNHEPVCDLLAFHQVTTNGTRVLDACGSYDPDPGDAIVAYDWSIVSGPGSLDAPAACDPTFTAGAVAGEFSDVCLTIWDSLGESSTCCTTIEATANSAPVALCRARPSVELDESCCIRITRADIDSNSFDPDGTEDVDSICIVDLEGPSPDCLEEVEICGVGPREFELRIRDRAGEEDTCASAVIAEDRSVPQMACPPDPLVPPTGSTDPLATGAPEVDDNCDPSPVVTFADTYSPAAPMALVRTWTATDADSNAISCVQTLTCEHPGWNLVDVQVELTAHEPAYWSAFTGLPKGVSPWTVLDPAAPPGRPDPDGSGERSLRGYIVAWAVNEFGEEIRWNHLSGEATVVNYGEGAAWTYVPYAFQALAGAGHGQPTGTPGTLALDGAEYEPGFGLLLFDFYAAGGTLAGSGPLAVLAGDLTLLPITADLRQERAGPVTTKASFTVWNMNEVKFTGMHRCITCWDEQVLGQYAELNHFLHVNLQTDKGKAQIDGLASAVCDLDHDPGDGWPIGQDPRDVVSQAAALVGVTAKQVFFPGLGEVEWAGTNLPGAGVEAAVIRADYQGVPPPSKAEATVIWGVQPGEVVAQPAVRRDGGRDGPVALEERMTASEKGSILIFPKIELRWDGSGRLLQDTYVSLINDYPGDVRVQMYFINGDPPLEGP